MGRYPYASIKLAAGLSDAHFSQYNLGVMAGGGIAQGIVKQSVSYALTLWRECTLKSQFRSPLGALGLTRPTRLTIMTNDMK